jgi:hypothetical protein
MGQELHRVALTYRMPWGEESSGITLVDMYLAELATRTWPGPLNRPGSDGGSVYWFPTSCWLACWAA